MIDKLLGPFIGYWYWAQDRATPFTKALALGAPLVAFGLMLYLVFGRGGDGNPSMVPETRGTQGNITAGTEPPVTESAEPATGGGQQTGGPEATAAGVEATTGPGATTGPAPTAFKQQRYEVASGDTPGAIAEKVGVPAEMRQAWVEEMLALNGVTATTLQVGQELILPPF